MKAILDTNCIGCHGSGFAAAGVRLDTYSFAFANRAKTVSTVEGGSMPPGGSMSTSLKTALRQWLDGGAPQN